MAAVLEAGEGLATVAIGEGSVAAGRQRPPQAAVPDRLSPHPKHISPARGDMFFGLSIPPVSVMCRVVKRNSLTGMVVLIILAGMKRWIDPFAEDGKFPN